MWYSAPYYKRDSIKVWRFFFFFPPIFCKHKSQKKKKKEKDPWKVTIKKYFPRLALPWGLPQLVKRHAGHPEQNFSFLPFSIHIPQSLWAASLLSHVHTLQGRNTQCLQSITHQKWYLCHLPLCRTRGISVVYLLHYLLWENCSGPWFSPGKAQA